MAAPSSVVWANGVTNIPSNNPSYISAPYISQEISPGVVGGIVSMMLEKNKYLTAAQIIDALRNSADKVSYNYVGGVSAEFAYGRVSCNQAMGMIVPTYISQNITDKIDAYVAKGTLFVQLPKELQNKRLHLRLTDMLGKTVLEYDFMANEKKYSTNIDQLSIGIYALSISEMPSILYTHKIAVYE